MVAQSDAFNEIEVSGVNLVGTVVVHHLQHKGDESFHDEGIAVGTEVELAILLFAENPNATLATVYQVLLGLVSIGKRRLLLAEVNQHLIAIHPIVQRGELFNYFVLGFVDGHELM